MADPLADACQLAGAGVAAMFTCAMGFPPIILGPVLCGAVVGALSAPPTGRWHGAAIFIAVVALSALAGTAIAEHWHAGSMRYAEIWGAGLAALFHPLLEAIKAAVPERVRAILKTSIPKTGGDQ